MSTFPPGIWDVRVLQDMDGLKCSSKKSDDITLEAFIAVKPAGGEERTFRFALGGSKKLKLSLPVNKVLRGAAFDDMLAEIELVPGDQIRLEKNSVRTIGYHKNLVSQADNPNKPGICMCWVLGTKSNDKQVLLMAQVQSA